MKIEFFLKVKAWQLNLISIVLLFSAPLLLYFGPIAFKLGLNIWFVYNQLYLNTICHFIKEKIPQDIRPNSKLFAIFIKMEVIFFVIFTFFCLGPDRVFQSISYAILLGLSIGLLGIYCIFFVIKTLLIAEKNKAVDFGDVVVEYIKMGFTSLNIFFIQKRAIESLSNNERCL